MALEDVLESSDFQSEDTPIENSLAAELTGTAGYSDDALSYESPEVPGDLAEATEEFDRHQAHTTGQVPLAALKEERTRRQELQRQLTEAQQQRAAMEQQFQQVAQQIQAQQQAAQLAAQQAQQEAQIPQFSEDPEGHINALKQQFTQALEGMQQQQAQVIQQHQQAAQVQQLRTELSQIGAEVGPQEAEFAARQPDYPDAAQFVQARVAEQLRARHPGINNEQLGLLQAVALGQVAQHCKANGVNPAQFLYERALAHGWQGNAAQVAPAHRPTPTRPSPPNTLATAGGAVERGVRELTLESVASMSDADFEAAWSKMAAQNKPKFGF